MKRLRASILIAILAVAILLTAAPAYAQTADPDSTPTVESINVYRNLLETDDRLFVIYANIPYAVTPDETVAETFIWQLFDTDNTTELGSTTGYAYNDDGYGYNVYAMYFSAADNITWGQTYLLRLSGNPVAFATPPTYNYLLDFADYTALVDSDENQTALAAHVVYLAADLDNKWGLAADYSLLLEIEIGPVLSVYGEAFFRGAIYGLQALAPAAFRLVIRDIEAADRTWTDNYTANLTNQWSGTWVETAQEGGQALFGTTYDLMGIIILLILGGGLMVGNIMLTSDAWNGFVDCAFLMIIGAKLGMYALGFLGLVAALCILYLSAKIWFGGLFR